MTTEIDIGTFASNINVKIIDKICFISQHNGKKNIKIIQNIQWKYDFINNMETKQKNYSKLNSK